MPGQTSFCCNTSMSGYQNNRNGQPDERLSDKLFRMSRESYLVRPDDRWIGGVCGAIARRMGWNVALVRAVMILCIFLFGAGAAFYGFAWFVFPDSYGAIIAEDIRDGRWQGSMVGIIICWLLAAGSLGIGVASFLIAGLLLYCFIRWSRQEALRYFTGNAGPGGGPNAAPGYGSGPLGPSPAGPGPYGPGPYGAQGPYGAGPYGYGGNGSGGYNPGAGAPGGNGPGIGGSAPYGAGTGNSGPAGPDPRGQAIQNPGPYALGSGGPGWQGGQQPQAAWQPHPTGVGPDPHQSGAGGEPGSPGVRAASYPSASAPAPAYTGLSPEPRPRVHRLRRKPAGPGLVSLMLGLILVSGGVVWIAAVNPYRGLPDTIRIALVWAAAVTLVLGITILVLGCIGRRSGGLTPIAIISALVVLVLSCISIGVGNAEYAIRSNLDTYHTIRVGESGRKMGSTREEMERYRSGILLKGDVDHRGKAVIDLTDFEKNNGTHQVEMTDSDISTSGCPTGEIRLAALFADIEVILPQGCTYSFAHPGDDLLNYGPDVEPRLLMNRDWWKQQMQDRKENGLVPWYWSNFDQGDEKHMPDNPELNIRLRPDIGGHLEVTTRGTATLPERKAVNNDNHRNRYHDDDEDWYTDQGDEDDE